MAMYPCTNPKCPNKRHRSTECPNLPKGRKTGANGVSADPVSPPPTNQSPYTPAVQESYKNLLDLEPSLKMTSVEKIVTVTAQDAHRIYDAMEGELGVASDSVTREAMFELSAAYFGNEYEDYYSSFSNRIPMEQPWPEGEPTPAVKRAHEVLLIAEPLFAGKSIEEIARDTRGNAHRIYDYMVENGIGEDSWTRESMFDLASEYYDTSYEEFYQAWMEESPIQHLPKKH